MRRIGLSRHTAGQGLAVLRQIVAKQAFKFLAHLRMARCGIAHRRGWVSVKGRDQETKHLQAPA